MGEKWQNDGFLFFTMCSILQFNISHLSVNYSLLKGDCMQKINPHFDPITDITTTKLYELKPRFLME